MQCNFTPLTWLGSEFSIISRAGKKGSERVDLSGNRRLRLPGGSEQVDATLVYTPNTIIFEVDGGYNYPMPRPTVGGHLQGQG